MKRRIAVLFSITIILSSCSSDKVVTNALIQKRKYNKGFYISGLAKRNDHQSSNPTHSDKSRVPQHAIFTLEPTISKIQLQTMDVQDDEDLLSAVQTEAVNVGSIKPAVTLKYKNNIARNQDIKRISISNKFKNLIPYPQMNMFYILSAVLSLLFTILILTFYLAFIYLELYGS